jgi:uncharacterized protein (PEP-CTERM system associated)
LTPANRRRSARPRPHAGCIGLGLLAVLVGCPVVAQTINRPAAAPDEIPLAPPSEPLPATTSTAPPPAATPPPASPFGVRPGVFPTISPAPLTPGQQVSPFGPAPGVFPGISPAPSPAPSTSATPGTPASPGVPTTTTPEQPISPVGALPGTYPGVTTPPQLLTPGYGFGTPFAPVGGTPAAAALPPQAPPTGVGLQPLRPGALPVQAQDLRAPPILITPSVSLFEAYTDNPRTTPNTLSDSITHLNAGTSISVDSVRLQGQLNGSIDYQKYARATDLDSLNANLLGYGLGTIVRDHVYVDGRAAITQLSRTGGVGFANSTVIPPSQQTQTEVISLSPIVRQSIGDVVDGEFRYNLGMNLFQNGSLLKNSTITVPVSTTVPSTSLSNSTTNDATLSIATGRRFTALSSKLTLEATEIASQSAARSTQLRGFDDVQYQINQEFAALGRFGYEDIRYSLQPAASTKGMIWLIGGQWTPSPDSSLIVHYGREAGFNAADGTLRYQVTPRTTMLASLQQSRASSQASILGNLNSSQLASSGSIVNQATGLPSALVNPEFANAVNTIFRLEEARIGMQTTLDRDTYGIFGFHDRRAALGTPTGVTGVAATSAGSDTSLGANLNWGRSLTPNLTSSATLGYAMTQAAHSKTLTADLSLNYTMGYNLSALVHYQFINVDSAIVAGSYRRNLLEIGVTRSF